MKKPNTEAGMPIKITLDSGTYFRCTCGGSQNLPFCDGSHSGTQKPLLFEINTKKVVYICSCGKSETQPFCNENCGVKLP